MSRAKWTAAGTIFGCLLGLGAAAWRAGPLDGFWRAEQATGPVARGEPKGGVQTYQGQFNGVTGRTFDQSTPAWPEPLRAKPGSPNVIFIILDDVGFAQLSCFGGLCKT